MSGRENSIYLSLKDGVTSAANSMRSSTSALKKEMEETASKIEQLEKKQDSLRQKQIELRTSTEMAKTSLAEAKKAFRETGEEADRVKLENLTREFVTMNQELRDFQGEARRTTQEIDNLRASQSKLDNRADGGMLGALGAAGFTRMAGNTLTLAVNANVASAFGSEAATMFASTLSSATQGAVIGSIIPGIGTALGAAIGGGLGYVNGLTETFKAKDEAFKNVYSEAYSEWTSFKAETLSSGSGIAAQREMDKIAFDKLLGGSDVADEYLEWLTSFANYTPFLYSDLTAMSKTMAPYGFSPEEMQEMILQVGDTGAALGMDAGEMQGLITVLGRMNATGNTSLRYINQLIEKGIPAVDYLADSFEVSTDAIYEAISKGLIPGADAAKIISTYMGEANKDAMALQALTFSGLSSTVEGLYENLNNAMGEGYNETRKIGLEYEIEMLTGETAEQMQEAYRLMGEYQAQLENEQRDIYWATIQEAMKSKAYMEALAEDNGAEMGRILAEARAEAEDNYRGSEAYDQYEKTEISIVQSLREKLAPHWETYGYTMGIEMSKGLKSTESYREAAAYTTWIDANGGSYSHPYVGMAQAAGIRYVPYDEFPARLHEGERVLTASEARAYNRMENGGASGSPVSVAPAASGNIRVTVTGNNFTVRNDDDIHAIALEIAQQLSRAQQLSQGG